MFKWLIKLFEIPKKKCKRNSAKECPLEYSFDANGFKAWGHGGCCQVQDQINSAARLSKKLKLTKFD